MVIEMRDNQSPVVSRRQRMENIEKDHRIQPAGDSDQNRLAPTQELPGENSPFNSPNQIAHRPMLLAPAGEASWLIAPASPIGLILLED